jgi:hypothetical protein
MLHSRKRTSVLVSLLALVLTASACTGGDGDARGSDGSDGGIDASQLTPDSDALPPPAPATSPRAMAVQVLAGGETGLAALLGAVSASGIWVRDGMLDDPVVVEAVEPAQGMTLEAGEVLASMDLVERGGSMSLQELADAIDPQLVPVFGSEGPGAVEVMLGDLATAADSSVSTVKFWARFVVELGRQAEHGYDLLARIDLDKAQLNAVQATLLLTRLGGGLAAIGAVNGVVAPSAEVQESSFLGGAALTSLTHTILRQAGNPCDRLFVNPGVDLMGGLVGSNLMQQAWGWFMESQTDLISAENVGRSYQAANAILALVKLLMYLAAFKMTVEVEGGPPLVRTKTTRAGERRTLTATLRYDTGDAAYLNCFRPYLNAAGVDLNLPPDGPIADTSVEWSFLEGDDLVRYYSLRQGGNAVVTTTGSDGKTRTGIEGIPQDYVIPGSAPPIDKWAFILVNPILVTPGVWNDLMSAIGTMLSGIGALPFITVSELAMRGFGGFFARKYEVPVTDWARDLKIDAMIDWFHYSGIKCDGPDGEWVITIDGRRAVGIAELVVDGHAFVRLNGRSLFGRWGAVYRVNLEGVPVSIGGQEGTVGGRGRFDTTAMQLILPATTSSGDFWSRNPKVSLFGDVQPAMDVTLPVEAGDFCEE